VEHYLELPWNTTCLRGVFVCFCPRGISKEMFAMKIQWSVSRGINRVSIDNLKTFPWQFHLDETCENSMETRRVPRNSMEWDLWNAGSPTVLTPASMPLILLCWVRRATAAVNDVHASRYIVPKGATFGLFPPDAPSAEALPLPRSTRDRSSSDPATMFTLAHGKRSLPPTPSMVGSPPGNNVHCASSSGTYRYHADKM